MENRMTSDTPSALPVDRDAILRRIDRLDVSADMKMLLSSLLDTTIEIGGKIIDLGARVLNFAIELAKAYPGTAFGLITALVISYLISSIPVIGPVLAPFLTPLLLILGVGLGALDDLTDGGMRTRLNGLKRQMEAAGLA